MVINVTICIFLIALGILLCFNGLRVYKLFQMVLCGALLGYVGIVIQRMAQNSRLIILTLVLILVGVFIGYKFYKIPLGICSALTGFVAVFTYFWKQALVVYYEQIGEAVNASTIISKSISGFKETGDIINSLQTVINEQFDNVKAVFEEVADIVQRGLLISILVGIILAILVLIVGDFVISIVTSMTGSFFILFAIGSFVAVPSTLYSIIIIVFTVIGTVFQIVKNHD